MAQKYGFFNAVVSGGVADRVYNADDINNFFEGVLSDGVYQAVGNALLVTAGTGLNVLVNTGRALVKSHWYNNDTIYTIAIATAHPTLSRITSIVLRYSRSGRTILLDKLDGTPAATPVAPTLTQTDDIYEVKLADVLIAAGATSLTDAITDHRVYVNGLVDPTPLAYRRYDFVVTGYDTQRYYDIPFSYNLTLNTKLEVYVNGMLCMPSEYTIQVNEVEGNYMVVFYTGNARGSELSFVMIN